jgi:hypothetical protein
MGRPSLNGRAMSDAERQRRRREKVRNDPARATSKLWLEEAERVAAGLWVMTWIAQQRGIDIGPLMELKNRFEDLEAVLYSQIWPDRTVADGHHETVEP